MSLNLSVTCFSRVRPSSGSALYKMVVDVANMYSIFSDLRSQSLHTCICWQHLLLSCIVHSLKLIVCRLEHVA